MSGSSTVLKSGCLLLAAAFAAPAHAAGAAGAASDYPTVDIADYVLACMQTNGGTRDALERCSCSIDVIASIIPYSRYEAAATFKRLGMVPGENGALFRESLPAKSALAELKRAQAEADVRCF